jgi:hypothetical protein
VAIRSAAQVTRAAGVSERASDRVLGLLALKARRVGERLVMAADGPAPRAGPARRAGRP